MNFIDKLEKKFGKFAIPHLMRYVIIAYAVGYILYLAGASDILSVLSLDASKILQGQVWRIISFIVQPPTNSMPIFFIITLYFYYLLGTYLEKNWGAFRFNLYFFSGVALHLIAAIVIFLTTGYVFNMTVYYLNMSLFLAFAVVMPNNWVMLFFIIPFKMKWLAYIDAAYIAATIFFGYLSGFVTIPYNMQAMLMSAGIHLSPVNATAAAIAILNFVIYFIISKKHNRKSETQKNFRNFYNETYNNKKDNYKDKTVNSTAKEAYTDQNDDVIDFGTIRQKASAGKYYHKCCICGKTDLDYPDETFRYCSQCDGAYEYCSEHLKDHKHVRIDLDGKVTRQD